MRTFNYFLAVSLSFCLSMISRKDSKHAKTEDMPTSVEFCSPWMYCMVDIICCGRQWPWETRFTIYCGWQCRSIYSIANPLPWQNTLAARLQHASTDNTYGQTRSTTNYDRQYHLSKKIASMSTEYLMTSAYIGPGCCVEMHFRRRGNTTLVGLEPGKG